MNGKNWKCTWAGMTRLMENVRTKCDLEKFIEWQRFIQFQLHNKVISSVMQTSAELKMPLNGAGIPKQSPLQIATREENIKCTRLLFRVGNELRIWFDWLCKWWAVGRMHLRIFREICLPFLVSCFSVNYFLHQLFTYAGCQPLGPTIHRKCFENLREACLPFNFKRIFWMEKNSRKWCRPM